MKWLAFDWGESEQRAGDRKYAALAFGLVIFVHLLPRLVLGERSYVVIHDNLDSDFLYRVLIAANDRFWSYDSTIPELLGGLPRLVYPSPFKLSSMFFHLLPPFWAYVTLELTVRSIAFWGMYRLIEDHLPVRPSLLARLIVVASFATLPFYVIYDASIAGQPLVAWALLNLWRARKRLVSFIALFGFTFASVLPTSGAFVVATAGLVWLGGVLFTRRLHLWMAAGVAFLVVSYGIVDFRFIQGIVAPPYESHRSLWLLPGSHIPASASEIVTRTQRVFLFGRYHSASLHTVILAAVVFNAGLALARRQWRWLAFSLVVLSLAAVLSFTESFGFYEGLRPIWDAVPFTRGVHVRFHWLLPTLWFVALAVVIGCWQRERALRALAVVVLVGHLAFVCAAKIEAQPELRPNYTLMWSHWQGKLGPFVSYQEFVSKRLFQRVAEHIGRPKSTYRVISVGLFSSIAAFNGFQAADGYHDNYPVAYKQRLRKLIAPALARDKKVRQSFDDWGSRAYLSVRELPKTKLGVRQAKKALKCKTAAFDPSAARDLDVEYLFSACKILEPDPALHYEGVFTDSESAWRVHLYRVEP